MFFKIIVIFCLIAGCSGYRTVDHRNPFDRFGIKMVSIPGFVSHASIAGVGGPITSEIYRSLSSYSELKVVNGVDESADAVLIGIISSGRINEAISSNGESLVTIGKRKPFYVTSKSLVKLNLNLVLIKNPVWKQGEVSMEEVTKKNRSTVIFSKALSLSAEFTREIRAGEVNATKTSGSLRKVIRDIAVQASDKFKNEIINAY